MTKKKAPTTNDVLRDFKYGDDATNGRLKSKDGSLYYKTKTPPVEWMEIARWDKDEICIWLYGRHSALGATQIIRRMYHDQSTPSFHTYEFDNPVESARVCLQERVDFALKPLWLYRYECRKPQNTHSPPKYATNALNRYRSIADSFVELFGGPKPRVVFSMKTLQRLTKQGTDIPLSMWASAVEEE